MSKKKDSLKPWLSRPAINRSVTLPLTRPLTQRLSNLNEFHPNELDPFLLFDARDSMIGTLENPTLDLDPSKPDTLNVITATRSGIATYTDVNGNIATASADTVRVDYTQGSELTPTVFQRVGYTDFSSGWGAGNGATVSGTGSYNGAVSKQITAVGYSTYFTTVSTTASQIYNVSFYARLISGSASSISIYRQHTETSFTYISLTNEWQRFDVAVTASGSSVNFGIAKTSSNNPAVFEITQPQVTEGTTASDFVENTTGSPKFIASATYGPRVPMILVEPSATNLVTYSEDFENTGWTAQAGITLTSNTTETLSPEGLNNSYKVVSADNTKGFFYGGGYISITSAATRSIFLKGAEGGETITLKDPSGHGTPIVHTLTTEWVRYEMSTTNDGNTYQGLFIDNISVGTIYAWGAQVEAGSVATSYIPTSGSTVTRAADDLVITGSDFDFYNQSEGTFYVESVPNENTSGSFLFDLTKISGESERLLIYNSGSNQKVYITTASSNWVDKIIGTRPAGGVLSRVAISYETNNVQASLDGVNMVPDPSATMSTSIAKMTIGNRFENSAYLNGRIRRLIFWPYSSDRL